LALACEFPFWRGSAPGAGVADFGAALSPGSPGLDCSRFG
jgi:hypothetical protein